MRELIAIGYPDAKAAEAAHDALLTLPREDIFRISESSWRRATKRARSSSAMWFTPRP